MVIAGCISDGEIFMMWALMAAPVVLVVVPPLIFLLAYLTDRRRRRSQAHRFCERCGMGLRPDLHRCLVCGHVPPRAFEVIDVRPKGTS